MSDRDLSHLEDMLTFARDAVETVQDHFPPLVIQLENALRDEQK